MALVSILFSLLLVLFATNILFNGWPIGGIAALEAIKWTLQTNTRVPFLNGFPCGWQSESRLAGTECGAAVTMCVSCAAHSTLPTKPEM